MARSRKYKELEASIGYTFKSVDLLERALTHASARTGKGRAQDNERLEFIGDRVLGLTIVELLDELYPEASEGELARRLNHLVRGTTCARMARIWGLGRWLLMSEAEAENGGRDKDGILADACEALLGGIFREAGYETVRTIVRQHWQPLIDHAPGVTADPKSALQEWTQGQGLDLPSYAEVSRKGPDHAPMFTIEVRIPGKRAARGEGQSKRVAEQAAATTMLIREGVWKPTPPSRTKEPRKTPRRASERPGNQGSGE